MNRPGSGFRDERLRRMIRIQSVLVILYVINLQKHSYVPLPVLSSEENIRPFLKNNFLSFFCFLAVCITVRHYCNQWVSLKYFTWTTTIDSLIVLLNHSFVCCLLLYLYVFWDRQDALSVFINLQRRRRFKLTLSLLPHARQKVCVVPPDTLQNGKRAWWRPLVALTFDLRWERQYWSRLGLACRNVFLQKCVESCRICRLTATLGRFKIRERERERERGSNSPASAPHLSQLPPRWH